MHLGVFVHTLVNNSIEMLTGELVGWAEHLEGSRTCPLEVGDACDVLVIVHKDVALVEIGQGGNKRPAAETSIGQFRVEGPHGC